MKYVLFFLVLIVGIMVQSQEKNIALDSNEFASVVYCKNIARELLEVNSFKIEKWDSIQIELKSKIARSKVPFAKYSFKKENDKLFLNVKVGKEIDKVGLFIDGIKTLPYKYKANLLKTAIDSSYLYNLQALNNKLDKNKEFLVIKEPQLLYFVDSAVIYTLLKKVKNNSVSGILGLANDSNGKFKIQGELQLKLHNMFNHLEKLDFSYQSLNNSTQNIQLDFSLPYIVRSNIGFNSHLELFKQDSSFINLALNPGLFYSIDYNKLVNLNYTFKYSNSISSDCNNCADISFNGLGIQYQNAIYNTPILPLLKRIDLSVDYGVLKTDLSSENQYIIKAEYTQYIQIRNSHWSSFKLLGGYQSSDKFIGNNAFRIGGLNDLRGYNQQSIYTDKFGIGSLSYAYVSNDIFLVNLFFDIAYLKSPYKTDATILSSLGLGFDFISNVGLLKLIYAIPFNNLDNSGSINNGKIHIGIINTF